MLRSLAGITLLLTGADHWTTYQCLHVPVTGWQVVEANPLAQWLFDRTGLVTGLAIDTFVTVSAIAFLVTTTRLANGVKIALLAVITLTTGFAVVNNLQAMLDLGLLGIVLPGPPR